ncbi:MAG: ComEC/Rec2 family competence protein, partial [Proteobacteria bacterium]|nr:ComEC/Rec2 family competence protein [Pseudomonadota bacterium]
MRLLRLWAVAFLLGAFLFKEISVLPNCTLSIFFLITALIAVIFSRRSICPQLFSAIYLGFSWALCYTHILLSHQLPIELENKDQVISGVIASIPENKSRGIGFEFQTSSAKIKLSWYGDVPKLQVGDRWQLKVRLKRLHGFSNPGGFDSEMNGLSHGIHTIGTVRNSIENKCIESHWFSHPIDRIREFIVNTLDQLKLNSNSVGVIKALIVGVRDGITQSQWEALRATGTIHLVVIAGLHVSLISGFIYFCVARF